MGWRTGIIDWDVARLPRVDAADYECIVALFKICTNVHHFYIIPLTVHEHMWQGMWIYKYTGSK